MTWPKETIKRAHDVIARYPKKRSAVMPLLYMAMQVDGYLTEDGMRTVADLVDITPAQVKSAATFYNMYKTQDTGKYLVSVCSSISCYLLGADAVLEEVEMESGVPAGESDGEVAVEHAECIGACAGAPALLVNYELVEGVTPEKAGELVRWLRDAKPDSINTDEMQALFGGRKSFDWGIKETNAAVGPFPAFPILGTAKENTDALEPGRGE